MLVASRALGNLLDFMQYSPTRIFQEYSWNIPRIFSTLYFKLKGKGKRKDKKAATTKKGEGSKPSCTHYKKEGHDNDHCWKLHLELNPKRFGGKGKQKTVETV